MALATRGTNFCKPDVVRHEWELAKELGLNITVHVAMDRFGYTKMQLSEPPGHGPAVPEHDVHPRLAPDRRGVGARPRLGRQRLVRAADRAPDGPRLGAGGQRRSSYDVPIGLSSDVATTAPSDQFTQMRSIFALGARPHATRWRGTRTSMELSRSASSSRRARSSRWATHRRRQGRRASRTGPGR